MNNFKVFHCHKCDYIINIVNVVSFNQMTGHRMQCPANKEFVLSYENELKNAKTHLERVNIHTKYNKLIN